MQYPKISIVLLGKDKVTIEEGRRDTFSRLLSFYSSALWHCLYWAPADYLQQHWTRILLSIVSCHYLSQIRCRVEAVSLHPVYCPRRLLGQSELWIQNKKLFGEQCWKKKRTFCYFCTLKATQENLSRCQSIGISEALKELANTTGKVNLALLEHLGHTVNATMKWS